MSTTTLDLKGLLCPMPIVKIAQAIKKIAIGDTIEATATDPGVLADIPAWARSTGQELVSIDKKDNKEFRFVVKRAEVRLERRLASSSPWIEVLVCDSPLPRLSSWRFPGWPSPPSAWRCAGGGRSSGPSRRDLSPAKGSPWTGMVYAFTLGMAPWAKESTRRHMLSYLRGVAFHIGIFAGLAALVRQPLVGRAARSGPSGSWRSSRASGLFSVPWARSPDGQSATCAC